MCPCYFIVDHWYLCHPHRTPHRSRRTRSARHPPTTPSRALPFTPFPPRSAPDRPRSAHSCPAGSPPRRVRAAHAGGSCLLRELRARRSTRAPHCWRVLLYVPRFVGFLLGAIYPFRCRTVYPASPLCLFSFSSSSCSSLSPPASLFALWSLHTPGKRPTGHRPGRRHHRRDERATPRAVRGGRRQQRCGIK